ncbi:MAG: saccharopine dehydrogenase NADP-binding domain-containing protein [Eubacteriaceae bacterium]|nr:saccharopine dehydrogenase NADP-binding domain-containing protein [Eubacteriaceae bacterium]
MVEFGGKILQFGFGAVGKSFYEKVAMEVKFDEYKYFVITRHQEDFNVFINLGGMAANFAACEITKDNFRRVFGEYLDSGDLLLDFADTVGTKDICDWCAEKNIMYLNTGDADWPENWLNIFEQSKNLNDIIQKHKNNSNTNIHPIVLQHGNNPGLVSHFVKAAIEYIAKTQFKRNKELKSFIKKNEFNKAAQLLGIKTIHVNDIDLQVIDGSYKRGELMNTWCIDSFFFEMLSEGAMVLGSHEDADFQDAWNNLDVENGYLEYKKPAAGVRVGTFYPKGAFAGFPVPHEEILSIAKSLQVILDGKVVYRPSVMFLYQPCSLATEYMSKAKVNEYPNPDSTKPLDCENADGQTIIRGYEYPLRAEIVYREKILSGTEYVGIYLAGDQFRPVWVGNRVELPYLYMKEKGSYWQTPTITPVAVSALAAVCWMVKNVHKGGIFFPDEIDGYKDILKIAEKHISKTIYMTFDEISI